MEVLNSAIARIVIATRASRAQSIKIPRMARLSIKTRPRCQLNFFRKDGFALRVIPTYVYITHANCRFNRQSSEVRLSDHSYAMNLLRN